MIYHTDPTGHRYASLVLSDVEFEDTLPVRGLVDNGGWDWSWSALDKACFAKDGDRIQHRWRCERPDFLVLPDGMGGGYNTVLAWAEKQERSP